MPRVRIPFADVALAAIFAVAAIDCGARAAEADPGGTPPDGITRERQPADPPPNPLRAAGLAAESIPVGTPTSQTANAPAPSPVHPLEIQCRAAQRSSIAHLYGNERGAVRAPDAILRRKRESEARVASLRRSILSLAAEEARNRDAGTALIAYWSLAEADRSLHLLAIAGEVADQALSDHDRLSGRGLDLPIPREKLLSRRFGLDDATAAALTVRRSLAIALGEMVGLSGDALTTSDPATDIAALDESIDVEAFVAEGVSFRPELRMLRLVGSTIDAETADVARAVLAQVSPLLGGEATPSAMCIARLSGRYVQDDGVPALRRAVREWTDAREAAVAGEIRVAAIECSGNVSRVTLARRQLELEERMAADLRARLPIGESDALAIHLADLEVVTARRTLLERQVAWEKSRVKLLQARGLLASQCGFGIRCAAAGASAPADAH